MLPYFTYTEEVHNFCHLMGYTIDDSVSLNIYACTYSFAYRDMPFITKYNLTLDINPLIPPEKVMEYLTLILNGYSTQNAINQLGVVGNGRSSAS